MQSTNLNISFLWCDLSFSELYRSDLVKGTVLEELTKVGKTLNLKGFEQVKKIYLEENAFTAEKGLLTATLKSKRPQLKRYYEGIVERLYEED